MGTISYNKYDSFKGCDKYIVCTLSPSFLSIIHLIHRDKIKFEFVRI